MKFKIIILIVLMSYTWGLSSCDCMGVYSSSQLLAILNSLEYEYLEPRNLPLTEDIQIIGTVTISSEQMEVPEECTIEYNYCG